MGFSRQTQGEALVGLHGDSKGPGVWGCTQDEAQVHHRSPTVNAHEKGGAWPHHNSLFSDAHSGHSSPLEAHKHWWIVHMQRWAEIWVDYQYFHNGGGVEGSANNSVLCELAHWMTSNITEHTSQWTAPGE